MARCPEFVEAILCEINGVAANSKLSAFERRRELRDYVRSDAAEIVELASKLSRRKQYDMLLSVVDANPQLTYALVPYVPRVTCAA